MIARSFRSSLKRRTAIMNVNRKLQKLHQWSKEKMGGDSKGGATDDLKALEVEMNLRHEGRAVPVSFNPHSDVSQA